MSAALVEYVERLGGMWNDELQKELLRINACINVAASKELQRPFFARRRLVEALIESRKDSVEQAIEHNGWNPVPDKYPDADESVLGLDADVASYCVVTWDGESWGDAHTSEARTVTHWMRLVGVLAPPQAVPAGGAR